MFAKFSYYQFKPLNLKEKIMNVLSSGDHSQKRKLSLMIPLFLNTNNIYAHKVISHTVCLNIF